MTSFGAHSELKIIWNDHEISIRQGNITTVCADAIAISCAPSFAFSDGVAKAVARAAGAAFKSSINAVKEQSGFTTPMRGEATIFSAGRLKAKYIIGVCSPNRTSIERAYWNALNAANEQQCTSMCFCAFGTGLLHVPPGYSASKAINAIENLIKSSQLQHLKVISFMDISLDVVKAFAAEFKKRALADPNAQVTIDGKLVERSEEEDEHSTVKTENSCIAIDPFVDIISFPVAQAIADTPSMSSTINVEDVCAICLDTFDDVLPLNPIVKLKKCSHVFHKHCLQRAFDELQAQCPTCKMWYGVPHGNQPVNGRMYVSKRRGKIPGYPDAKDHFEITYDFPCGVQTREHPRPGQGYLGTIRTAYLPNNAQGRKVLELFRLAFRSRLMFTVGDSVTTGVKDVVVWNCIHNKTNIYGGPQNFGYPDETYLERVTEELAAVGVTEEMLKEYGDK